MSLTCDRLGLTNDESSRLIVEFTEQSLSFLATDLVMEPAASSSSSSSVHCHVQCRHALNIERYFSGFSLLGQGHNSHEFFLELSCDLF